MEFIQYSEVLFLMDKLNDDGTPVPFSVRFATGTGRYVEIRRGVKSVLDKSAEEVEDLQKGKKMYKVDHHGAAKKMWVNVKDIDTGEIKKMYPRTITHFNGLKLSFDI
jgi:hypothetical protein